MDSVERKRAGRPPGVASEETRARIVRSACRCFAEHGYAKTSNQDIARASGVTSAALYHYFDSKAHLFAEAHLSALGALLERFQRATADRSHCVDKLCALFECLPDFTRENPGLVMFFSVARVEIQRHPEVDQLLALQPPMLRDFLLAIIEDGHRAGDLAEGVASESVLNLVFSLLFGLSWLRIQLGRPEDHEAVIANLVRLLRGELFNSTTLPE